MLTFSAQTRAASLTRMAEDRFDVLVIGGGITGVGIALDAAARGLSVALVEKDDFAAGTSGRSSRLVHGGLRYLEHGEFGLVREALPSDQFTCLPDPLMLANGFSCVRHAMPYFSATRLSVIMINCW